MNPTILAAIIIVCVPVVVAIFKIFPERRNMTVDAAQKAVGTLAQAMDELSGQLVSARNKIDALQQALDKALERVHELEAALDREREKVHELEQRLRAAADGLSTSSTPV